EIRSILQLDAAAMVFEHAADDREPKSGALCARSDIWFEQTRPRHLRQSDTVIDHVDHDVVVLATSDDIDTALAELFRRTLLDRLGRILDNVGQRLRDQSPVELGPQRIFL